MKIKLLLILISILNISCLNKKQEIKDNKHDELINNLVLDGHENLFSNLGNPILFCKLPNENEYGYVDLWGLKKIYQEKYINIDYQYFLTDVLNQKRILDSSQLDGYFKLNDTIMQSYRKESFSKFLAMYNEKVSNNEYSVNRSLSLNAKYTIFYCLFLNEYYTTFDDYIGIYYSSKYTEPTIEPIDTDSLHFTSNKDLKK